MDIYNVETVFLRCKFIGNQIITDNFGTQLCNLPVVDLGCLTSLLQSMVKNVLEKFAKESKLLRVVITSRYWWSLWLSKKAFRQSQSFSSFLSILRLQKLLDLTLKWSKFWSPRIIPNSPITLKQKISNFLVINKFSLYNFTCSLAFNKTSSNFTSKSKKP